MSAKPERKAGIPAHLEVGVVYVLSEVEFGGVAQARAGVRLRCVNPTPLSFSGINLVANVLQ